MKFSVIIPTWRDNQSLKICLNSLLAQDYPKEDFEIILISKKNLKIKKPRVKVVQIGDQINHAQARNLAIPYARGEILAFCDDDCILPPNWLSSALPYFRDKKLDLIGGPALPSPDKRFNYHLTSYLIGSRFVVGFAAYKFALFPEHEACESDLILANTFIKKSVFNKLYGFNEHQVPCEENLLYAEAKKSGYKLLSTPHIACYHQAKPIFVPWAEKVFFYATGRGQMIGRAPRTLHVKFLIPSLSVISLPLLIILSFFYRPAAVFLLALMSVYIILVLINSFLFFIRDHDLKILIVAPLAICLTHIAYGLGLLNGLLRYSVDKREALMMPSKH